MPWSDYEAVLLQIPEAEAERIATEHGASEGGSPTFEEWWVARIDAAVPLVLGTLRGNGYSPPDDPAELTAADALLLSEAIAQQAVLEARPHEVRVGGGEKYPVAELCIRLRQIVGGIVRLDMSAESAPSAVFIPGTVNAPGYRRPLWYDDFVGCDSWWP